MRILILISTDHYIRQFVTSGAFEDIEREHDIRYVASEGNVKYSERREILERRPGFAGFVQDPRPEVTGKSSRARFVRDDYKFLRQLLMAAQRRRSRTMRHKLGMVPRRTRLWFSLAALPGIRAALVRRVMRRTGLNRELHALIERERPQLILAPTGGTDTLLWDGARSAKALGIPMLVLIHNWDNLSSKGLFPTRPDYIGVWGEQSVEHAERIHGFDRDRIFKLGAPQFKQYFRHEPGSTESPFPFRYVLFAGCFAPFDELTPLQRLEAAIEERQLPVKVLYRPHPHRARRAAPDFFDETKFRHVVLDPAVRDNYFELLREYEPGVPRGKPLLPPLEDYPALFEHCEFVICPLSTMIVEAAIFERRVIVVACDDGVHPNSPAQVIHYDHFQGVEEIEGFDVARTLDDAVHRFVELVERPEPLPRSLRSQVGWWLHWDDRSYSRRLADLVEDVGRRERAKRAQALPVAATGALRRGANLAYTWAWRRFRRAWRRLLRVWRRLLRAWRLLLRAWSRLRRVLRRANTRFRKRCRPLRERRDVLLLRLRSLPPLWRKEVAVERPNTFFSRSSVRRLRGHVQRAAHREPGLRMRLADTRIEGVRAWEYATLLALMTAQPDSHEWLTLDVGTGKSALPGYLLRTGKVGRVTTLDLPDPYEATPDQITEEPGITRAHGSMLEIPFEDGAFDLVTCISAIEHLDGDRTARKYGRPGGEQLPYREYLAATSRALSELARVVRPGGFLYVTTDAYVPELQKTDRWTSTNGSTPIWSAYRIEDVEDLFVKPLLQRDFELVGGCDYDRSLLDDPDRANYRGRYFSTFAVWARRLTA